MIRYEGPLFRPPSEADSLILQATIGCSYNRCTFCGMYRAKRFRVRPLAELEEEIGRVAQRAGGAVRKVFLADGDALVAKTSFLAELLERLARAFPELRRVSCYASPQALQVLALPRSRLDPYDSAYANAAVLSRAGVEVAILAVDASNPRNLPFHATMAAAFGLAREEAVRAITYYPARVLGLEEALGSLAPGKLADLVVTDGHLLEITSRVEFVAGEQADLSNRETSLCEEYRARLHRLQAERGAARGSER